MTDDPAPQMPLPVTAGAAPYWTSPQFKGLLATLLVAVLGLIAHFVKKIPTITYQQALDLVNDVEAIAVPAGIIWALVQRARSKVQPLKFSKAAAAAAPETIAVVQTQAAMKTAGIPTAVELAAIISKPIQPSSETTNL